jgi:hypothetical protein
MNTQKLLFILLVALVILFIFGIIAGQRGKGASPPQVNLADLSASSLNSLFSAPLNLDELHAIGGTAQQCLQTTNREFTIAPNKACSYEIASSAMPTRKLGLHLLTAGSAVDVDMKQNRSDAFDVAQKLPDDEPLTLSITKGVPCGDSVASSTERNSQSPRG